MRSSPLLLALRIAFRGGASAGLLVVASFLTGCATTQVSYKTVPDAPQRVGSLKQPAVAPPHVEVFELSAGGVSEKRDDWTAQVNDHLRATLVGQTGYKLSPELTPEQRDAVAQELQEVTALLQVITLNHLSYLFGPPELSSQNRPLNYQVGRIDRVVDAFGTDALLFVFVRDEYSTGGRKALMALGVLAGAVTGVYIVPRGGLTVNGAALVERDGTVLWFNYAGSGGDMRTPEGARETAKLLLAGLPRAATATPAEKR